MKGVHPTTERLAALSALAAEINGRGAPTPIAAPVLVDEAGRVLLPVPDHDASATAPQPHVWCKLHHGLTLQWAPLPEQGDVLLEFRGGSPDGDADRDAAAVYLTRRGLRGLISDLQAIEAHLRASSGERPDALPLTDPDAPAVGPAGVSAPEAAQSRHMRSRPKPEASHG